MSDDFRWSAGGLNVTGLTDYANETLGLYISNLTPVAKRDLIELTQAGHTIRIVVEPKPFVPGYYRCTVPNPSGAPCSVSWYRNPPWSGSRLFPNRAQWEEVEVTVK